MTNTEFAQSYLSTAQKILKESESLYATGAWHLVVRRCQECVELCLKGLLRQAGIEIPRLHDVGPLFLKEKNRFSNLPLDRIISISRRLREEREVSFYGDDLTETSPESLYIEQDAKEALEEARFIAGIAIPESP